MQKIQIKFDYTVNEKTYSVICEPNSPFADCKEAAFQFLKEIGNFEEAAKAQVEKQKEEEKQEAEQSKSE